MVISISLSGETMNELQLQAMSRAELHRYAADAIAADGRKPSIASLRQWTLLHAGIKRGSDTDTQADVTAWWRELLALKSQKRLPDVPEAISSLATVLWKTAVEAAAESLASGWSDLAEARLAMQKQIEIAVAAEQASKADADKLGAELQVAHASNAGKDDTIAGLRDELAEARSVQALKDQRMEGLASDLARTSHEHVEAVQQIEELRRSLLVQLDQARQDGRHWQKEFSRVESESRLAVHTQQLRYMELQSEIAEARGRMSVLQENLAAQQTRNRHLEDALALARSNAVALSPGGRRGRTRLARTSVMVKKR